MGRHGSGSFGDDDGGGDSGTFDDSYADNSTTDNQTFQHHGGGQFPDTDQEGGGDGASSWMPVIAGATAFKNYLRPSLQRVKRTMKHTLQKLRCTRKCLTCIKRLIRTFRLSASLLLTFPGAEGCILRQVYLVAIVAHHSLFLML